MCSKTINYNKNMIKKENCVEIIRRVCKKQEEAWKTQKINH